MKFSATLDVNVVAHEATDEVTVLLDLEAPAATDATTGETRPPAALQVVLDRSGSMAGDPLWGALRALEALVARLDPRDSFGLVVFDDRADVVVPAGPLTDKAAVVAAIRSVEPGGTTDLSAGYLRGLQELRRGSGGAGGTLLLISDGHANAGVSDPVRLGELARTAHGSGVVTSTLGYGLGYDETLLSALARGGSGNHVFATDPDAAGAAVAAEVDGLLDKVVLAASLLVRFGPEVRLLRLYNDLPSTQVGTGEVMVEIGDLYAGEQRRLLLRLEVPAMAALGLAQVAELELRHVELPALVEHTVTLPVTVNVVPGDEAAGRVPDPTVTSEVLFQEAQESKRLASEALERGDRSTAKRLLDDATETLDLAGQRLGEEHGAELVAESRALHELSRSLWQVDPRHASKSTRASFHRSNRKRGRTEPGDR